MENKPLHIQVIGSGCASCKKLHELTTQVAHDLGIKEEVEYSNDVQRIVELGMMSSPLLVVNNVPILAGFTPDRNKIEALLKAQM